MKNESPKIVELAERPVAFVSFTGNYIGNPQIFGELFGKLCGWAGPKGLISPTSVFLSAYQDDPRTTQPDELRLDVCMSIPEETEVDGDVQKRALPGGTYALMHSELTGPEEYGPAWTAVVEWVNQSSHEIDMSRPSYEIYLNNPEEHPEKHHIVDICMSVKEKG
ncbi:MAG: GyrI-like domain-containing protein [Thermodesulfobacteriota bacterium]|nr:GyrI-like domain-containing protein [Thermodesulfobacteriota bacterium]